MDKEVKEVQKPFRPRRKKKVCLFCAEKIEHIDYKDVARISPKDLRFFPDVSPVTALFIRDSSPPLLSAQDRSLLFPIFPTKSKRAFCPLYFIFI